MTGVGCERPAQWKKSKSSKGYYRRIQWTDDKTGETAWFTETSVVTTPKRHRGYNRINIVPGGSYERQGERGIDVYIAGVGWFIMMRGSHEEGVQTFMWPKKYDSKANIEDWLDAHNIPWNKVYYAGQWYIKMAYGVLYASVGWKKSYLEGLGYREAVWITRYWIGDESGYRKDNVTKEEYDEWCSYIDIVNELNYEEMERWKLFMMVPTLKGEDFGEDLQILLLQFPLYDAEAHYDNCKDYFNSIGWNSSNWDAFERTILEGLWDTFWYSLENDNFILNRLWWIINGYV